MFIYIMNQKPLFGAETCRRWIECERAFIEASRYIPHEYSIKLSGILCEFSLTMQSVFRSLSSLYHHLELATQKAEKNEFMESRLADIVASAATKMLVLSNFCKDMNALQTIVTSQKFVDSVMSAFGDADRTDSDRRQYAFVDTVLMDTTHAFNIYRDIDHLWICQALIHKIDELLVATQSFYLPSMNSIAKRPSELAFYPEHGKNPNAAWEYENLHAALTRLISAYNLNVDLYWKK